ncbi:MAG: AAA family ATPase, partial [Solirubrobacteraceae bacterium]
SHGMRQRLGIAAALLREPRLLLLDEPATGLDPAGMRDMRELIRRLAEQQITVLLSSHQLPEVQELCDRVAIVDRGRVVYEGALTDLRRQGGAGYRLRSTDDARALEVLRSQPGVEHVIGTPPTPHGIDFQAQERDVGALSLELARTGVGILALTPKLATLEDLFFRLTESNGAESSASAEAPIRSASQSHPPSADSPVGTS